MEINLSEIIRRDVVKQDFIGLQDVVKHDGHYRLMVYANICHPIFSHPHLLAGVISPGVISAVVGLFGI